MIQIYYFYLIVMNLLAYKMYSKKWNLNILKMDELQNFYQKDCYYIHQGLLELEENCSRKFSLKQAIMKEKVARIIILADFAQIMDYQTWVNNNEMNSTKYIDKIQEQRKEDAEEPFYIQTIKADQIAKIGTVCAKCGYKAKWKSEMKRHQRMHSKKRPFKCQYCYWTSKWKSGLTKHISCVHKKASISR